MSQGISLPERPVARPTAGLPGCIHEMFEAQAHRTPDGVAVSFHQHKLTYRELNEQANQLARHLRSLGVKAETPVALYLERSPWMVIAIVAVLKAGGTYVPIDLAYPLERVKFMLEDARATVLLTQPGMADELTLTQGKEIEQLPFIRGVTAHINSSASIKLDASSAEISHM